MHSRIRKYRILGFILILIISCLLLFLSNLKITKKRYNRIMSYFVARTLTAKTDNFEEKVLAIRNFVHETVHPLAEYENVLATSAIEKMISGVGWCDQISRVFMQLARGAGITTRLLFLQTAGGKGPHAVGEALSPEGQWVIVDPLYVLDLINKNGKLASQDDIKNNKEIVTRNKRIILRAQFDSLWSDPEFLSAFYTPPIYITTKKGNKIDFLKFVPLYIIRPIVEFISKKYLEQLKPLISNRDEFIFIEARIYHLLGRYERADKLYENAISSNNVLLINRSKYYKALLLKDQKKYQEAIHYITDTIRDNRQTPFYRYLIGLRARILFELDRHYEADTDLRMIEYDLGA